MKMKKCTFYVTAVCDMYVCRRYVCMYVVCMVTLYHMYNINKYMHITITVWCTIMDNGRTYRDLVTFDGAKS